MPLKRGLRRLRRRGLRRREHRPGPPGDDHGRQARSPSRSIPGIAEAVETDLRNAQLLFPLVKRLAPGLDVKALAQELRERIGDELDYEVEAQNHRAMARAWRNHPFVLRARRGH